MTISTLSSSINAVDQAQKEEILAAFAGVVKGMDDPQKDLFVERMLAESNKIKESITRDSPEFAEKVLRDTEQ